MLVATFTHGPLAMWALISVGLFHSIMFPTIFTLGIRGLGPLTEEGSGLLIMAIAGGALVVVQGWLADRYGLQWSFLLTAACELYVLFYALWGSRTRGRRRGSVGFAGTALPPGRERREINGRRVSCQGAPGAGRLGVSQVRLVTKTAASRLCTWGPRPLPTVGLAGCDVGPRLRSQRSFGLKYRMTPRRPPDRDQRDARRDRFPSFAPLRFGVKGRVNI